MLKNMETEQLKGVLTSDREDDMRMEETKEKFNQSG